MGANVSYEETVREHRQVHFDANSRVDQDQSIPSNNRKSIANRIIGKQEEIQDIQKQEYPSEPTASRRESTQKLRTKSLGRAPSFGIKFDSVHLEQLQLRIPSVIQKNRSSLKSPTTLRNKGSNRMSSTIPSDYSNKNVRDRASVGSKRLIKAWSMAGSAISGISPTTSVRHPIPSGDHKCVQRRALPNVPDVSPAGTTDSQLDPRQHDNVKKVTVRSQNQAKPSRTVRFSVMNEISSVPEAEADVETTNHLDIIVLDSVPATKIVQPPIIVAPSVGKKTLHREAAKDLKVHTGHNKTAQSSLYVKIHLFDGRQINVPVNADTKVRDVLFFVGKNHAVYARQPLLLLEVRPQTKKKKSATRKLGHAKFIVEVMEQWDPKCPNHFLVNISNDRM